MAETKKPASAPIHSEPAKTSAPEKPSTVAPSDQPSSQVAHSASQNKPHDHEKHTPTGAPITEHQNPPHVQHDPGFEERNPPPKADK